MQRISWLTKKEVLWALVVVLISLLTLRNVVYKFGDWQPLIDAAMGVVEGRPHWRAFQNRLLGPYVVVVFDWALNSRLAAIIGLTAIAIVFHNVLLHLLLRIQGVDAKRSAMLITIWSFLFLALQDRKWLYTWDLIDVVVFTMASYIVLFAKSKAWLLVLFPVALLNRESALYLPVAYLICVFMEFIHAGKADRFAQLTRKWFGIAMSVLMLAAGIVYTKMVRDALFIESSFGGLDEQHVAIGNHFNLVDNIQRLFVWNFMSPAIIHNVLVWGTSIVLAGYFIKTRDVGIRSAIAFYALIMVNILCFGLINEARMLFPLLSLAILIYVARDAEVSSNSAGRDRVA